MGWANLIGETVEHIRDNGIKVNWRAMVYLLMKMVLITKNSFLRSNQSRRVELK